MTKKNVVAVKYSAKDENGFLVETKKNFYSTEEALKFIRATKNDNTIVIKPVIV